MKAEERKETIQLFTKMSEQFTTLSDICNDVVIKGRDWTITDEELSQIAAAAVMDVNTLVRGFGESVKKDAEGAIDVEYHEVEETSQESQGV